MAGKTRATQRRTPVKGHEAVSVQEFFFRRLPDGTLELRKDTVNRAELWGALEWYHRKVTQQNRWYRQLWRALKGAALININPFKLMRANGVPDVVVIVPDGEAAAAQPQAPEAAASASSDEPAFGKGKRSADDA